MLRYDAVIPSFVRVSIWCLTGGVAVEGKVVESSAGKASDDVLGGEGLDARAESSRRPRALESKKVSTETGNVGRSHRGSGDGVGAARGSPGGDDANTRGEDVDNGAVVAEGGDAVAAVGGANGADSGLRSGRVVGSIGTVVTGGNSEEKSSTDSAGGSGVDGGGLTATERHVGNRLAGAAARASPVVIGSKVNTGDDARVGSLSGC